jgi:hypothetical protein
MFQQHPYVLRALVADRQAELPRVSEAGRPAKAAPAERQPVR